MKSPEKLKQLQKKSSLVEIFHKSQSPVVSGRISLKPLGFSHSSTLSPLPSQESLKIQEAYQFLMFRDIGCSRKQAISLASKSKLNNFNYLSSLPQNFRRRLVQTLDEEKYQIFTSSEDEVDYANLNEMLKKTREKRKNEKKDNLKNFRRINLKIFNRNSSLQKKSDFKKVEKFSMDEEKKVKKFESLKNNSIDFFSQAEEKFRENGRGRNLRFIRKEFFSIRRNSLESSSESDVNYQDFVEKEKESLVKVRMHKQLLDEIKKKQINKRMKNHQECKRLKERDDNNKQEKLEKKLKNSKSSRDLVLPQMHRKRVSPIP
jgi:hypothetical protein